MKNLFKIVCYIMALVVIPGCGRWVTDAWDGKWQTERAKREIAKASEICDEYKTDEKLLTEEYKECVVRELGW